MHRGAVCGAVRGRGVTHFDTNSSHCYDQNISFPSLRQLDTLEFFMRFNLIPTVVLLLSFCPASVLQAYDGPRKSTKVPRFDAAVDKALNFLQAEIAKTEQHGGEQILVAYALTKCGIPKEDPFVAKAIVAAAERSGPTGYKPITAYDHIYGAGVDSMLLSDANAEQFKPNLQVIANYVQSVQRADGSWSDGPQQPGDVSMSQYGILALWACQRAGCEVSGSAVDRAGDFLMKRGNGDGGWGYRPGTTAGPGAGASTHNMTMAGAGSVGVVRIMLHGPKNPPAKEKKEAETVFGGALTKVDPDAETKTGGAFKDYRPQNSAGGLDSRVDRAFGWNQARLTPISRVEHNLYFYYCIERAAAISDLGNINGQDWFIVYGDGLLELQQADGSFPTWNGPVVGTSFALLYYMRSTQQIIDKQFGAGRQQGKRGNPFGDKEIKREPTELDLLIGDIEKMDFTTLDESPIELADEIVLSVISIDDPEKLIGQKDKLKSLMKHPNKEVRRSVVWALGRTGDFSLVPLMLDGIRDIDVDVNIEAIQALRFIARKPAGFGETLAPFASLGNEDQIKNASPEARLKLATPWREKALKDWSNWYFRVRPHEEQDSFDQLQVAVPLDAK